MTSLLSAGNGNSAVCGTDSEASSPPVPSPSEIRPPASEFEAGFQPSTNPFLRWVESTRPFSMYLALRVGLRGHPVSCMVGYNVNIKKQFKPLDNRYLSWQEPKLGIFDRWFRALRCSTPKHSKSATLSLHSCDSQCCSPVPSDPLFPNLNSLVLQLIG